MPSPPRHEHMNARPLTVTLPAHCAERVRDAAQAQGVTYESMVTACVQMSLYAGGPVVLQPWGEPESQREHTQMPLGSIAAPQGVQRGTQPAPTIPRAV